MLGGGGADAGAGGGSALVPKLPVLVPAQPASPSASSDAAASGAHRLEAVVMATSSNPHLASTLEHFLKKACPVLEPVGTGSAKKRQSMEPRAQSLVMRLAGEGNRKAARVQSAGHQRRISRRQRMPAV